MNGDGQITRFVATALNFLRERMATCKRVVAALNFLTGEGIVYYPDNCNNKSIEVLISDHFDGNRNEDGGGSDSEESPDHKNEGLYTLRCL